MTLFLYPHPPRRWCSRQERNALLPKVSWIPARKDEAGWKGDMGTSHLSMLMGSRVHRERWIVQKIPKPYWSFNPPLPRGPILSGAGRSPPWLAWFPIVLDFAHPFLWKRPPAQREDAQGIGEATWSGLLGAALRGALFVILFSGSGIWGGTRAHDMQHFESRVGRDCDRYMLMPLKIAILLHLKGSYGTSLFLKAQYTQVLCQVTYMHCVL